MIKLCALVATVESIAIVTADDPLKLVPDNPVPIVNAFVVVPPPPPAAQLKVPLVSDDSTYPFTAATAEGNVKVYEPLEAGFNVSVPALVLSI